MKIVSKIFGGLGNQMFQYACGRAVTTRLKSRLCFDLSWFEVGNRTFMLNAFPNIKYSVYHEKQNIIKRMLRRMRLYTIKYIDEQGYSYWSGIEEIKSSVHLSGYWQDEKYFSAITPVIKKDFMFPEFECLEAKNIQKKIKESACPVSIHVRRGDYVEDSKINSVHGTCSPDYYKKAIQLIIDKYKKKIIPELYLFSDDPDWVKNNFNTCGLSSVVIDIQEHKDKPYHDMHLMSLCQHHIIAKQFFLMVGSISFFRKWNSYFS